MLTKSDILNLVEDEDVRFIRLQFTDMMGQMRNMAVTVSKLVDALDNKCSFDGGAVKGFDNTSDTDLFLYPDLDTFTIFPWRPHQGKVARLICDVYTSDRKPLQSDPRLILKRVLKEAEDKGYTFDVGPECEFFLFKTDDDGTPTMIPNDEARFFDLAPMDNGENCRRDICLTLEEMGYTIESSHHEMAPGQHEIVFSHDNALVTADRIVTFRTVVKTLAKRNGMHATFMPKPKTDEWGSGMHLAMSLFKDGKNAFYNPEEPNKLSNIGYKFISGLLKYSSDMACITNPTVNSYKRFAPGYEAPCFTAWSESSKSFIVRVPKTDNAEETRIELRSPDSTSNPYLAIAACLKAGLKGIDENYGLSPAVNINPYSLTRSEREALGVTTLPISLNAAVEAAKKSAFLEELLGANFKNVYLAEKEAEYSAYRKTVSRWEIEKYFIQY